MKKAIIYLSIAILLVAIPSIGQNIKIGLVGGLNMPVPKFSDSLKTGYGGMLYIGYQADNAITLIAKSGYLFFPAKTIQTNEATRKTSYAVIPILFGARYTYQLADEIQLYGQAEMGVYLMKAETKAQIVSLGGREVVGDENQTKFGFSPVLGAQYKLSDLLNINLGANFSYLATENDPTMWIGINLGAEVSIK